MSYLYVDNREFLAMLYCYIYSLYISDKLTIILYSLYIIICNLIHW